MYKYIVAIDDANMISFNNEANFFLVSNDMVEISWDKDSLLPPSLAEEFGVTVTLTVDIQLLELDTETGSTQFIMNLASNISNTGQYSVIVPSIDDKVAVFQVNIAEVLSEVVTDTLPAYVDGIFNRIKGKITQWSDAVYLSASNYVRDKCDEWYRNQPEGIGEEILERLPPCPPTAARARADNRVFEEEDLGDKFRDFFHPNTSSCFRQIAFTE